jgi:DNA polymerase V
MPQPQSRSINTAFHPALLFITPARTGSGRIPYFPQGIPAGFPSPANDHLQKELDLHEHLIKHPAATFFAHVQGDCLNDANIYDGDLLIIDRAETPRHKSIVVAIVNGEFTVKRLYKRNGEIRLVPENKASAAQIRADSVIVRPREGRSFRGAFQTMVETDTPFCRRRSERA